MAVDMSFLAGLANATRELEDASEELLQKIAMGELDRDAPEFLIVCRNLAWDERRQREEINRMRAVLQHKRQACGDDEFARRVEHADALRKTNASKRSKLEEKMAALRSELASLDFEERKVERALESAEIARAKLRELAPSHIRDSVNKEISRLHAKTENQRRLELEGEIRLFKAIVANEIRDNQVFDLCKARFQHALGPDHLGRKSVVPGAWDLIRNGAQATLDELQAEFDALDEKIRSEEAAILQGLDFYIGG